MIYLDTAATTPLDPKVFKVMQKTFLKNYGNSSSIHKKGQEAKKILEQSRKTIAQSLGVLPEEIYFMSSGTQANNIFIRGILQSSKKKELIISAIEHASIHKLGEVLKKEGYIVHIIPVDKNGFIKEEELKKKLNNNIALVSIMTANNETGVVQDIQSIATLCKEQNIPFHTDAVQAYKKISFSLKNITACTISAHKIYGPKGAAALYIKKGTKVTPLFYGGQQEHALHPGTENLPAIIGFAKAAQIQYPTKKIEHKKQYFLKRITEIQNITLNTPERSLSNIISITIEGIEAETCIKHLSKKGICISAGSACSANSIHPSHVLKALDLTDEQARATIRISLGKETTKEDINQTIKHLKSIVSILRKYDTYEKRNC